MIAVTGLLDGDDESGIVAALPGDEVLEFFGVREDPAAPAELASAEAKPGENSGANGASDASGEGIGESGSGSGSAFPVGFASSAAAVLRATERPILAPLAGETADGAIFEGTLSIERFLVRDGRLFVVGRISGTLRDADGTVLGRVEGLRVRLPVTLAYENGELVVELGDLVLRELGATIDLGPLAASAAGQPGSPTALFFERLETVTQLVASGASIDAVAEALNSLVATASTAYATATGSSADGESAGSAPETALEPTTGEPATGETGVTTTVETPATTEEVAPGDGVTGETPPLPPPATAPGPETCPPNMPVTACETASH